MFGIGKPQQIQMEMPFSRNRWRKLFIEDAPLDKIYCPFCLVAKRAYFKWRIDSRAAGTKYDIELVGVDTNPLAKQELYAYLQRDYPDLDLDNLGFPLLAINGIVKIGAITEESYYDTLIILDAGTRRDV